MGMMEENRFHHHFQAKIKDENHFLHSILIRFDVISKRATRMNYAAVA